MFMGLYSTVASIETSFLSGLLSHNLEIFLGVDDIPRLETIPWDPIGCFLLSNIIARNVELPFEMVFAVHRGQPNS